MTTKYVASGDKISVTVAGTAVVSGEFRKYGVTVVHHPEDASVGDVVEADRQGRFDCTAENGVAWTAGDKLYKTAASQVMTKTSSGNDFAGYAAADKASAVQVGEIVLAQL